MPRSKEIQEQMRNNIVDMYHGKGFKDISKALGLQRTTVRAIIHKWRKLGTSDELSQEWFGLQERNDDSSRRS